MAEFVTPKPVLVSLLCCLLNFLFKGRPVFFALGSWIGVMIKGDNVYKSSLKVVKFYINVVSGIIKDTTTGLKFHIIS